MTTPESLTVKQILDLQAEAREAGDGMLAAYCSLALMHDQDAVRIVVDAIRENEAQSDACECHGARDSGLGACPVHSDLHPFWDEG